MELLLELLMAVELVVAVELLVDVDLEQLLALDDDAQVDHRPAPHAVLCSEQGISQGRCVLVAKVPK